MMRNIIAIACVVITCSLSPAFGHEGEIHSDSDVKFSGYGGLFKHFMQPAEGEEVTRWVGARADGHAPIGVMGDHTHKAGEWMVSYRYMNMHMGDLHDGDSELNNAELFARGYMIAPISMNMEMHMFGVMYAPTDEITLMVMLPYVIKSMKHTTMGGNRFTTRTEGIGDMKLTALVELFEALGHGVQVNFGLSIPFGSIDQRDQTAMGPDRPLPYPMQIGTGTFDLMPAIIYGGQTDYVSWGAEARGRLHLGRNSNKYSFGDRFETSAWVSFQFVKWLSNSLRVKYSKWDKIDGRDKTIPAMMLNMIPTADPDNHGGERIEIFIGMNIMLDWEWLKGTRIAIEFGMPVYENLNGPQLGVKWTGTIGLQYAF